MTYTKKGESQSCILVGKSRMNIFKQKVLHVLWLLPFLFLLIPSGAFAQTATSMAVTVLASGKQNCYNAGTGSASCQAFVSWKSGSYSGSGSATATFTPSGGATQTATCSASAGGTGSSSCASPWVSVGGYSCRVHFLGIAAIPMDQASGSVHGDAICNIPSGTISASPNPCIISAGANTCTSAISWSTTNTPSATVTLHNGTQTFGTGTSNPGLNASIPNGSVLYTLNDSNGNALNSVTVTGACASGTTWNGSGCASDYDSPSCTSSSGASLYTATPVKITDGPYSALNTSTINGYTTSRWNAVGSYSATITFNGASQTFTDNCTRLNSIDGFGVADACDHSTTVSVGGGTFNISSSLTSPVAGDWVVGKPAPYGGMGSVYGISCPAAAPPTISFTASPNPIAYGGRSTLTWSSSGATSCTAGGPWSNSGTLSGSGLTNPLTSNTTFTFQCTGPGGTSPLQSVTVGVGSAPSGTISATPTTCTIPVGSGTCSSTISWNTANTPSATVWIGTQNFAGGTSGSSVAPWIQTAVDTFVLKDSNGNTLNSVNVNGVCAAGSSWNGSICAAPVTASLTASPNPVAYNGQSTLTWSSSGATSCTAGGPWSNSGTLSGSGLTNPLTSNTTFTFQCTGPGGTSPLQSVTVTVPGALNGTCGSANGVAYPYGSSSYSPNTQCSSGTSNNTAFPTQGTSVSWTCVGANGGSNSPTCSASQNVHPNPSISLSPTNTTITLGQSVNYTVSSSDVVPDMTMETVNWIAPGQSKWNWHNSSYGPTVTPDNPSPGKN